MNTRFSLCRFLGAFGVAVLTVAVVACGSLTGLREVPVEHVEVQVGVGSPIPVDTLVSGTWPDLCAQLAEVRQRVEDFQVEITLLATPADPACPPDYVGLPFRIANPLNAVELPVGTYTVVANGVSTTFEWNPGSP